MRLAFDKLLLFIYFGAKTKQASTSARRSWICNQTVLSIFQAICVEFALTKISNSAKKIGGEGQFVEVDKSFFTRWENQVGRVLPSIWVVGGICRETKKVFLTVVLDRSAPTLMTANEIYVEPGTLIITDCWKSYSILDVTEDFSHFTVNHHFYFVDPETRVHTQSIECLWSEAKRKNKQQYGTHRRMLESYLCEFLRRINQGKEDLLETFSAAIVRVWPIGWSMKLFF